MTGYTVLEICMLDICVGGYKSSDHKILGSDRN